jgi:hypothetical protein
MVSTSFDSLAFWLEELVQILLSEGMQRLHKEHVS